MSEFKIPKEVLAEAYHAVVVANEAGNPPHYAGFDYIARWMREECAKVASTVGCNDAACGEVIAEQIRLIGTNQ